MIRNLLLLPLLMVGIHLYAQTIVSDTKCADCYTLLDAGQNTAIYTDDNDGLLVKKSAALLQQDIEMVTGARPILQNNFGPSSNSAIIIGTINSSAIIRQLVLEKKINTTKIEGKWDGYLVQSVKNPAKGIRQAIVIAGANNRGAAYGVFELSKQLGVSPWYWWADVPVKKKAAVYIRSNALINDAPKVKYRGIFINDEAPALSGWTKEKFGGFKSQFYAKVFELILRLKGNYIWPAMWGNAFYDDDSLNIKTADTFNIVIGTSHHEPLMRAHDEWRRYGKGSWDYDSNAVRLKEFWKQGMQRATNEKIVTVGMRGDGDKPMSQGTATALLERIVKDQRQIIEETTGKPASETPQLWALYKEVQDYYDKGMTVPDDVTLLLCDDNWGNIRRLPLLGEKPRKGGYGIYYHFDYVGGPRNYKWLNTNPIPRVWEQMHLAWEYNVRQIWVVNVGDIKPMEFPISFFLDYAWDPEKINADDSQHYTQQWAKDQFGVKYAGEIAELIRCYGKYNGRRKPELLDANTYSFNYNEWDTVVAEYKKLLTKAEKINAVLPAAQKDAYYELVLHPIKACANLNEMYYYAALNQKAYTNQNESANLYADKVKQLYQNDSLITLEYHQLHNGKWNQMMSQTHIGYTYWQEPRKQKMPAVKYLPADSAVKITIPVKPVMKRAAIPAGYKTTAFFQDEEKGVSMEAAHFSKAINTKDIQWKIIPDLGSTGSAITTFPVSAKAQVPGGNAAHVEYEFYTYSTGDFSVNAYFSPTLNFQNTTEGLQYAVSIDNETPQILSINSEDKNTGAGIWNKWVAENIIIKSSKHSIAVAGKHLLKYWMVNPGLVLQKLVLDFGGVQQSYFGPPETINHLNEIR